MIKYLINKFLIYRQAYFKKINKEFYSQFGEDKILFEIIPKSLSRGFYVDVGCFHPKNILIPIFYTREVGLELILIWKKTKLKLLI